MSCYTTLKRKGIRLTPQRRLVLDIIHETPRHITADEILNYVNSKTPGVNKSTIYRTLDMLEETGCVVKSEAAGRFIYHHAEEGHHHHLVCRVCGRSLECAEDIFTPLETNIRNQYGFVADIQHLVIKGLCRDCR
jgi:Fur family ferric uptake transcriptional regulator